MAACLGWPSGGVLIASLALRTSAVAGGFEENCGQFSTDAPFVLRAGGGVTLAVREFVLGAGSDAPLALRIRGGRADAAIRGEGPLAERSNYYLGLARAGAGAGVAAWIDIPIATGYAVRGKLAKADAFALLVATPAGGNPAISIGLPPDPLVFLAVAGSNCGSEGPY